MIPVYKIFLKSDEDDEDEDNGEDEDNDDAFNAEFAQFTEV